VPKWVAPINAFLQNLALKQALCHIFRKSLSLRDFWAQKKGLSAPFSSCCGERGIRTPGPVTVNGFQDRRIRPLCHLSAANVGYENELYKK
ncbi:MAG: hypothetical protein RIR55_659, partial [Bacteroidota bacterium]